MNETDRIIASRDGPVFRERVKRCRGCEACDPRVTPPWAKYEVVVKRKTSRVRRSVTA